MKPSGQRPRPTGKPLDTAAFVQRMHAVAYGSVHTNPGKCGKHTPCAKCKERHPCPASN